MTGLPSVHVLRVLAFGVYLVTHTAASCPIAQGIVQFNCQNQGLLQVPPGLPTSLQELNLNGNNITALSGSPFSGLSFVVTLILSNNPITSIHTGDLRPLTRLHTLNMGQCQLSTISSAAFSGLGQLGVLRLNNNRLTTIYSGTFSGLSRLTTAFLFSNLLTHLPPGAFGGVYSLRTLWLYLNALTEISAGVFDDSALGRLQSLDLRANQLGRIEDRAFTGCSSLTSLQLVYNRISIVNNTTFVGLTSLLILELGGNSISEVPSGTFSHLTRLQQLYLYGNVITSVSVTSLPSPSSLTTFYFSLADFPNSSPWTLSPFFGRNNTNILDCVSILQSGSATLNCTGCAPHLSSRTYVFDHPSFFFGQCILSPSPTAQPSEVPTILPTDQPTRLPSSEPSPQPTKQPTEIRSSTPTISPINSPSLAPTREPTPRPTPLPSQSPTINPTHGPTQAPSASSVSPTASFPVSQAPSLSPSDTLSPSLPSPTTMSGIPTQQPSSHSPTFSPTDHPASQPTAAPSLHPTRLPTLSPTPMIALVPTPSQSEAPTHVPSSVNFSQSTNAPTAPAHFSTTGAPLTSSTPPSPPPTLTPSVFSPPAPSLFPTVLTVSPTLPVVAESSSASSTTAAPLAVIVVAVVVLVLVTVAVVLFLRHRTQKRAEAALVHASFNRPSTAPPKNGMHLRRLSPVGSVQSDGYLDVTETGDAESSGPQRSPTIGVEFHNPLYTAQKQTKVQQGDTGVGADYRLGVLDRDSDENDNRPASYLEPGKVFFGSAASAKSSPGNTYEMFGSTPATPQSPEYAEVREEATQVAPWRLQKYGASQNSAYATARDAGNIPVTMPQTNALYEIPHDDEDDPSVLVIPQVAIGTGRLAQRRLESKGAVIPAPLAIDTVENRQQTLGLTYETEFRMHSHPRMMLSNGRILQIIVLCLWQLSQNKNKATIGSLPPLRNTRTKMKMQRTNKS
eukprot:m.113357 g.113357  ORF g.113357 m.113357 type:complete len:958 (+) comp13019_c0_seq1:215-3088(+)